MKASEVMDELANEIIRMKMADRLPKISLTRIDNKMIDELFKRNIEQEEPYYGVGSVGECMPLYICNDRDKMICKRIFPIVLWQSQKGENHRGGYVMADPNPTEPAYLRLKVVEKECLHEDFRSIIDNDGNIKTIDFMKANFHLKHFNNEIHGPSFAVKLNSRFLDMATVAESALDVVFCLKCQSWPSMTDDFFTRERLNNWPSSKLLDKVSCLDCLVVPVGHPNSTWKDIEWRLSFSVAERELILEMCGPYAKCMFALKAIKNEHIYSDSDKPTPFCSYFIKTACLWMCETFPHKGYSVMDLIRIILDWLIDCYQHRNLPHYFIPQQNLIGHLSRELCDDVRAKLTEVKRDLWNMVMSSVIKSGFDFDYVGSILCDILKIIVNETEDTTPEYNLLDHPMEGLGLLFLRLRTSYRSYKNACITYCAGEDFVVLAEVLANLIQLNINPLEILRLPVEFMMPIVENVEEIVRKGYGAMFKTRLYRYLGDVYTYLLICLRNRCSQEDQALYHIKLLDYYKLGAEMVFPDGWCDKGIGSRILLVKYHYLMGNYEKLKDILKEFEPVLIEIKENKEFNNRLVSIEINLGVLSHSAWAVDELLLHLFKGSNRMRIFLHPIALVLYIKARVSLNEGDTKNASNIVKDMEECLNMINADIYLKETTNMLIKILESLIGLLVVMRIIFLSGNVK